MERVWMLVFPMSLALLLPGNLQAATARAAIEGTSDAVPVEGLATMEDTPDGLDIRIDIFKAPPGKHGLHIHETGSCAELGNSAGGHYNPELVKHGLITQDGITGAHLGDLGNIEIASAGFGTLSILVPFLTVTGAQYNVGGRSVILHEKVDDFGQPTGNAGGRIGCGVIEALA